MWVGVLGAAFATGYASSGPISRRPSGAVGPWSPPRSLLDRLTPKDPRPADPEREARAAEKRERKRQKNMKEGR